ncbi:siderophore ABC transporter substrate-binding protein [Clostridium sp. NSJ-49]|uniref:Ferric siderophore ABC transporter,substrate-binding protein n=1 Tax=Clostridium disporicum TaxID=84024 RepID=A0A174IWI1_9CLOT|nr:MULTISPECIES: siderophore ABC transporter substrate-binding protein [Clostridium]MBC5624718.1 siderophore ABC transporter substrate-binding protein [Clostridium sp. NSJ-49]MDU6341326.1 siderophore ABC transporter substrate-binding protein [Clostridium sp.]CUO90416.1 ferric siderophore ABC transporter%2Csubstrate-binding protein [Clostridium disporicum]
MKNKSMIIGIILVLLIAAGITIPKFVGGNSEPVSETITITHELGETPVTTNPQKVVVFDYGILDALDSLGVNVTGVVQSGLPDYLTKYAGEEYSSIGTLKEPDMEAIFALTPDLIIISGRQADYYEELNKIAPTIHLGIDNADYLGSFKNNMDILGQIFGKEKEVSSKVEEIEKTIAELNAKVTEKNINGLITLANDGAFSVYGQESRFGIIHKEFGVTPVDTTIDAGTHGQKATFEYVAEKNPQYLFVVDRAAVTGGNTSAKELFDNELVARTDAYKNDNIVYLDPTIWYTSVGGFTSTLRMVEEVDAAIK